MAGVFFYIALAAIVIGGSVLAITAGNRQAAAATRRKQAAYHIKDGKFVRGLAPKAEAAEQTVPAPAAPSSDAATV